MDEKKTKRSLGQDIALTKNFRLIFFIIALACFIFFYREPLSLLVTAVLHRKGSSHGVFVPFITAYFLWLKSDQIKKIKPSFDLWPGILLLAVAIVLFLISNHASFYLFFSILSFLFFAGALAAFFFGKKIFVEIMFPLFFLATIIPIPQEIYNTLAEWIRAVNTAGSVFITRSLGVPVYRNDYDVYIPNAHLVVDFACSGIRYFLSFFTFSIVYAYLFKKGYLTRILVVLASIPLSLIAGTIRLSVVFLAAHYISPFWAEHRPHVFLSWVVFAVFLFGIIALDQMFTGDKMQHKA